MSVNITIYDMMICMYNIQSITDTVIQYSITDIHNYCTVLFEYMNTGTVKYLHEYTIYSPTSWRLELISSGIPESNRGFPNLYCNLQISGIPGSNREFFSNSTLIRGIPVYQ